MKKIRHDSRLAKIFSLPTKLLLLLILLLPLGCGRDGALEYPGGQKRPKFEGVSDEM